MPRKVNDGRGRLGGRMKGTANKPPQPLDEWVLSIINRNRSKFEKDLEALTPQERVQVFSNLINASIQGTNQGTPETAVL